MGIDNRSTMDIDATVRALGLNEENLEKALEEICTVPLNDGVEIRTLKMSPVRKDEELWIENA